MSYWPEFQSPFWLILAVFAVIGVVWRTHGYFIAKTYAVFLEKPKKFKEKGRLIAEKARFGLPYFFSFLALVLMAFALADATKDYGSYVEELKTYRVFIGVDSSSSMYGFSAGRDFVGCKKNSEHYPRIDGACKAMFRLIDDVEEFGRKKNSGGEKSKVGIVQFATNSYVISYPSEDYNMLRSRVKQMTWYKMGVYNPLGIFTNIHLAVWDMYLMALERNLKKDAGGTFLSGKELRALALSMNPQNDFKLPEELKRKLETIKEELTDVIFFVITDAYLGQMDTTLNAGPYSLRNELKLAAFLGLPVYFISTDEFHLELKKLTSATGGDFLVVRGDLKSMADLVSSSLKKRFAAHTQRKIVKRESYAGPLLLLALTFVSISLILKRTISSTLTDV